MGQAGSSSKVAIDAALLMRVKGALQKQRQIIKSLVGQEKLDSRDEDVGSQVRIVQFRRQ